MMTMIENSVLASEKTNGKNSFAAVNLNYIAPNIMTAQHHLHHNSYQNSLFSALDSEINISADNETKLITSNKDQNNNNSHNYFQFEPQHYNLIDSRDRNSDLLDYNYFTRFTSLIEMNPQNNKNSSNSNLNYDLTDKISNNTSIETTGIHNFHNSQCVYGQQLKHDNDVCAYCTINTDVNMKTLECNIHRICRKCFKNSIFASGSPTSISSSRKNSESKSDVKFISSTGVISEISCKSNENIINVRNKI